MLAPREMTARDRPFVACTWARGSRYGVRGRRAFALVDRLLGRPDTRVIVLATDERTVHAWAAVTGGRLHFVYVAPELRGEGLARQAITAALGSYPERISTTHAWPRPSRRFHFVSHALLEAA